jgi:hypothetical protein
MILRLSHPIHPPVRLFRARCGIRVRGEAGPTTPSRLSALAAVGWVIETDAPGPLLAVLPDDLHPRVRYVPTQDHADFTAAHRGWRPREVAAYYGVSLSMARRWLRDPYAPNFTPFSGRHKK